MRAYNEAIYRETGIENIATIIEKPSMESFAAMCKHEAVRILLVTGGPGVVKAAMQTGKRAICAGPGNPPVYVDDTACMKRAAKAIITGGSYDNNLLCIGEKEVFALDRIADSLMAEMEKVGGLRLNNQQLDALDAARFGSLTTGQIAAIETADVATLSSDKIAALTTAQAASLTAAQIQALTAGMLPSGLEEEVLGFWDFARDISSQRIPDLSPNRLDGEVVNVPARAVSYSRK